MAAEAGTRDLTKAGVVLRMQLDHYMQLDASRRSTDDMQPPGAAEDAANMTNLQACLRAAQEVVDDLRARVEVCANTNRSKW